MEDKYKKTLENVLILADEEVIEICTKKSYYGTCSTRAQDTHLKRENLCKLLLKSKRCPHHCGLNIKEKRLHKKIRRYTMKIVNFNTMLLMDQLKSEYFVVFYRSELSFNANIANFFFSGVRKTSNVTNMQQRKQTSKKAAKVWTKRVVKKRRNASFREYLRRTIKQHFYDYLYGEHSLISVHAIFTVDNPNKSKIFITRDIEKYSDIDKFMKMIDSFDTSLKTNVKVKLEECLEKLNIPMNNVLVIARINQSRKNLFIPWNDKLFRSLRRKNIKTPTSKLINTSMLNLRLDHMSFNGVKCANVKSFVSIIEEFVTKNVHDENIERKLEKQLNSCKTFIACLNAFETSQMSDITKYSRPSGNQTLKSVPTKQKTKPEIKEDVGDTGNSKALDTIIPSDAKVQGILTKIETLQKRIRTITNPSMHKDADSQFNLKQEAGEIEREVLPLKPKVEKKLLQEIEMTSQEEIIKRESVQKSKFYKPDIWRNSKDIQTNLVKIEEFLKHDFQESKLQIEGILRNEKPNVEALAKLHIQYEPIKVPEVPKVPHPKIDLIKIPAPRPPEMPKEIKTIEKLLKKKLESPDPKNIQENANNGELEPTTDPPAKTPKPERLKCVVSKRNSSESHVLKSTFAPRSVKLRPRSKQKRQKKPTSASKTTEPTVIKLENFIEQILNITKSYFTNGCREDPKKILENVINPLAPLSTEFTKKENEPPPPPPPPISKPINSSTIITIKKYTEMEETKSEMSTDTVKSLVRKGKLIESGVQTERNRRKRIHTKVTQTDIDAKNSVALKEKKTVAMDTQTDISIHKHAQIKFSGMSMQLSKNVTITNVRKNVINVRNICEETSEAVKRLLESETAFNEDSSNLKQMVETISEDLRKGNNKAEILGQIKNTLENVIDRFKKSTLLISKATNFADMTENLKKIVVPTEVPVAKKTSPQKPVKAVPPPPPPTVPASTEAPTRKEEITSNLTMSLKLLKNLSEVTKTIRKNPREAAKKLHGIRNELMQYKKNNLYTKATSKVSSRLYLPKTSSTLTSKPSRVRARHETSVFPKNVPLNIYGYPASDTDFKPTLNELNRIFTPKTRSICNTELSIIKHRDRHADHIASHLNTYPSIKSKYSYDLNKFRSKSAQLKSHKCQMYIAKTYKKSYANSLSQTACAPSNIPQIQTAIENPLVPKIVRPVRWKHPLPDSPQLSNLCLNDVKPFNSEYPRKDHVSASTHSYLNWLLESPDKHVPTIKCSDNDCSKCAEKSAPTEVSVCGKSSKETTDFIVKKGIAHFKTEKPKSAQSQVAPAPDSRFDFSQFMQDPQGNNLNVPNVNYTVCPINILQNKALDSSKTTSPPVNKKLSEVKNNQSRMQKSIQQAIIHNQEKFQAMQRILTLSKPQERKLANPPSSSATSTYNSSNKNSSAPPKIKSTHTKKLSKISDSSTSKSKSFSSTQKSNLAPQQTHSIQTAVATYKTVKQVQPHPKLKQLQQHQIPLKPKFATNNNNNNNNNQNMKKPNVEPNTSAFNKKYSDISLSSLKTVSTLKEEKQPKTVTQNLKNVKRSQEDIQKYIALVEQKFLKTFSLNEQEKEGAYKNLVDEIQGMLNVLNSKDKIDKKIKIKKSLEKLTKESESLSTAETVQVQQQKPVIVQAQAQAQEQEQTSPGPVKKNLKTTDGGPNTGDYSKTLESVEKTLKVFQTSCAENNKISEAVTEKLLNWNTNKSTHEDLSKTSVSSKTSMQYTLSEKERIIERKLTEYPATAEGTAPSTQTQTPANEKSSVVIIKDPISMATMDRQRSESEAGEIDAKKKNSDFSGPTMLSTALISSDSLFESDINYSGLSMNSFSKLKAKQNLRLNKSQSAQKTKKLNNTSTVKQGSPTSTETSLIPSSNDNTEDGYITITEFSETNSSNTSNSNIDINIIPTVEFSVDMYLCDFLHYSYRCQPPLTFTIPQIYHTIQYTEKIEPKPITQAYKKKYNLSKGDSNENFTSDYSVSSSVNFSSMLSADSYNIEQDFIKNYSDKLFTESLNTILSKNSDFSLRHIFGTGNSSTERLVQKTSSNFYEYIDLLSNISRIFIEPEVTQFYEPKFISYTSIPERETRTYHLIVIFCRVEFGYAVFNPSKCNLLECESDLSATPEVSTQLSVTQSASITQNTVSEVSDLTTSVDTANLSSETNVQRFAPHHSELAQNLSPTSGDEDTYYSVKSSITKFEFLNDNVEIQSNQVDNLNVSIQNTESPSAESANDEDIEPIRKLSLEELFVENICFASKKSSTYFSLDNVKININEEPPPEQTDECVKSIDLKRLTNQLAIQSNELSQLLLNNPHRHRQKHVQKLVSVKKFNAYNFVSNPVLNHFDSYDLKFTISPKYLATNFPSATCLQILPLLKNRIGNVSHSLTMKIELNHLKSMRASPRNISFKKPKRNTIYCHKNTQKSESLSSQSIKIQVQKKEMYTESYKIILIFLYVSIFSLIFICMTLNYRCD